jgi:hypothetical protein
MGSGFGFVVGLIIEPVFHHIGGEKRLQQPHKRDRQGGGQDDPPGGPGAEDIGDLEHRQAAGQLAQITHAGNGQLQPFRQAADHQDGHQGGGHQLGESGQQIDDQQAQGHQAPYPGPTDALPRGRQAGDGFAAIAADAQLGQLG